MEQELANVLRFRTTDVVPLETMLQMIRLPLCLTDPNEADNPIVFVNDAFLRLTGYSREEVLGRNCRFLQGPETTAASIEAIRRAIVQSAVETVEIINYRKDGSQFINALQVGPVIDASGKILLYFGSQLDVTDHRAADELVKQRATEEMLHRLRNIVMVMTTLIRVTAKEIADREDFVNTVVGRLSALSAAHFAFFTNDLHRSIKLKTLCETIVAPYAPYGDHQVLITGHDVIATPNLTTPTALALHELATNAAKHGALSTGYGNVQIRIDKEKSSALLTWTESGGPKVEHSGRSSGSEIIARMLKAAGATMTYDFRPEGLHAQIRFPALSHS